MVLCRCGSENVWIDKEFKPLMKTKPWTCTFICYMKIHFCHCLGKLTSKFMIKMKAQHKMHFILNIFRIQKNLYTA